MTCLKAQLGNTPVLEEPRKQFVRLAAQQHKFGAACLQAAHREHVVRIHAAVSGSRWPLSAEHCRRSRRRHRAARNRMRLQTRAIRLPCVQIFQAVQQKLQPVDTHSVLVHEPVPGSWIHMVTLSSGCWCGGSHS